MVRKKNRFKIAFIVFFLAAGSALAALDTEDIDAVIDKALVSKEVLDDSDFEVIEDFVEAAIEEMFEAEDFSDAVSIRAEVSSRKAPDEPTQYSTAFTEFVQKYLRSAFDELDRSDLSESKTRMERNFIILAAEMESIEMVQFGIDRLGHENNTIRYWAVKTVSNSGVLKRLNAAAGTTDLQLAEKITAGLMKVARSETCAEILSLIVKFAAQCDSIEAKGLLLKLADLRMASYENWTVQYEFADAELLKALGRQISAPTSEQLKPDAVVKFAQLYSYVMQRFILGRDLLSDTSKEQLVSVMVEVEQTALRSLFGRLRSEIKRAIEKKDDSLTDLQREHNFLLGAADRPGQLAGMLNFDYGKDPEGRPITAPKKLTVPAATEAKTETAQTSG